MVSEPFCLLVFKAMRYDSSPFQINGRSLPEALADMRLRAKIPKKTQAKRLGISVETLANWERRRNKPSSRLWAAVKPRLDFMNGIKVFERHITGGGVLFLL